MGKNQYDIISIGMMVVDQIVSPVTADLFQRDSMHVDMQLFPGGDACNAAVNAAAMGMKTCLVTCIGADPNGTFLEKWLQEHGLDLEGIKVLPDVGTAVSLVMVEPSGERHFLSSTDIFERITPDLVTDQMLSGAKFLSFNSYFRMKNMDGLPVAELFRRAHRFGVKTLVDTMPCKDADRLGRQIMEGSSTECPGRQMTEGSSTECHDRQMTEGNSTECPDRQITKGSSTERSGRQITAESSSVCPGSTGGEFTGNYAMSLIRPALQHTDIFLPSYEEAVQLTGKTEVDEISDAIRQEKEQSGAGLETLIVKLGSRGCYVTDFVRSEIIPPVPDVHIVNTTGAGDTFCAGFMTAQAHGMDIFESARFASAAAAFTVETPGAVGGIPSFDAVYNRYRHA